MDDYGNHLITDDNWLITLFPYFPDAASMTAEGNYYGGH